MPHDYRSRTVVRIPVKTSVICRSHSTPSHRLDVKARASVTRVVDGAGVTVWDSEVDDEEVRMLAVGAALLRGEAERRRRR